MFYKESLAIEGKGLSKCYHIYDNPTDRIRQILPWQKKILYKEFWALKNCDIELKKGETLGIIGKNGSGKSTLLQILSGTLNANEGTIKTNGRIGALLELGSGFNPECTGEENIRMNGLILGLSSKELEAKIDSIKDFADIGEFVYRPVKTYSSGMVVRLAFSVQAHLNQQILILDEALAVGDELFQRKCLRRLELLKDAGTSIILVSHSCALINQFCDRAMLMSRGKGLIEGGTQYVTQKYQSLLSLREDLWEDYLSGGQKLPDHSFKRDRKNRERNEEDSGKIESPSRVEYRKNGGEILSIEVYTKDGIGVQRLSHGEDFRVVIRYRVYRTVLNARFGIFIADKFGRRITGQAIPNLSYDSMTLESGKDGEITAGFRGGLWPGFYYIGCGMTDQDMGGSFIHRIIDAEVIEVVEEDGLIRIGDSDMTIKDHQIDTLGQQDKQDG